MLPAIEPVPYRWTLKSILVVLQQTHSRNFESLSSCRDCLSSTFLFQAPDSRLASEFLWELFRLSLAHGLVLRDPPTVPTPLSLPNTLPEGLERPSVVADSARGVELSMACLRVRFYCRLIAHIIQRLTREK